MAGQLSQREDMFHLIFRNSLAENEMKAYDQPMLIEFSLSNFRSVLGRQTLSMVAASYDEMRAFNSFDSGLSGAMPRLLRSAVLYGPNASGKSTLIHALDFMQTLVLQSHGHQAGDKLQTTPFKLAVASREDDSEFDITFVQEGVRYEYGFRCNRDRITEEWMLAYPQGRAQKWFHRVFDPNAGKDAYKFSATFQGGRKRHVWASETLENTLFFSKAIQNKHEQLRPAFDWFRERLRVVSAPHALGAGYTVKRCANEGDRQRIVDFMNAADLCIADIRLYEEVFSSEQLPKDLPSVIREEISKELNGKKVTTPKFVHTNVETNESIEFDEEEESNGTRALFAFAGPWLDVTENERVLVVDELDASLHPMLVHHLVKRLHHEGTKAQLIFTTHDTTLLSQRILRRDQVWFMEKDQQHASRLYPLSDFSPREQEAIERGYLNGRYGGIPFLKDLDFYGD
jgi:AAA15 family ATPase/GTPase